MLAALLVGSVVALISAVTLGTAFGIPHDVIIALVPKSVTTGVAMGIAQNLGGDPTLAAVLVMLTGMTGGILVTPLMNLLRIQDMRARGFAAGLAAHGVGTARAFQVNEVAGAFAGIALGLNAFITAILAPLAVTFFALTSPPLFGERSFSNFCRDEAAVLARFHVDARVVKDVQRRAMADGNDGRPRQPLAQHAVDAGFARLVEGGGGFVEEKPTRASPARRGRWPNAAVHRRTVAGPRHRSRRDGRPAAAVARQSRLRGSPRRRIGRWCWDRPPRHAGFRVEYTAAAAAPAPTDLRARRSGPCRTARSRRSPGTGSTCPIQTGR